jgi:hypothetical protein
MPPKRSDVGQVVFHFFQKVAIEVQRIRGGVCCTQVAKKSNVSSRSSGRSRRSRPIGIIDKVVHRLYESSRSVKETYTVTSEETNGRCDDANGVGGSQMLCFEKESVVCIRRKGCTSTKPNITAYGGGEIVASLPFPKDSRHTHPII